MTKTETKVETSLTSLAIWCFALTSFTGFFLGLVVKAEIYPKDYKLQMREERDAVHYTPHFLLIDVAIPIIALILAPLLAICIKKADQRWDFVSASHNETAIPADDIICGLFYLILAIPYTLLDAGLISAKGINGVIAVIFVYFAVFIITGTIYYKNKAKGQNDICNV